MGGLSTEPGGRYYDELADGFQEDREEGRDQRLQKRWEEAGKLGWWWAADPEEQRSVLEAS